MGHYCSGCTRDSQIVQELPSALTSNFSAPAYWNNTVYFWAENDVLRAFSFNANGSGLPSASPIGKSARSYAFPGATPVISANGTTNGIVWSVDTSAFASGGQAVLHPHKASSVAVGLYKNKQACHCPGHPRAAVKFVVALYRER